MEGDNALQPNSLLNTNKHSLEAEVTAMLSPENTTNDSGLSPQLTADEEEAVIDNETTPETEATEDESDIEFDVYNLNPEQLNNFVEEPEEADDNIPELGIDDPEAQKLWEQRWKGVQKRERKVREAESDLSTYRTNKERYTTFDNVVQSLEDKATYKDMFFNLARSVAQMHGVQVNDLIGSSNQGTTEVNEFEFEDDRKVYEKAKADALAEVKRELAPQLNDLDEIKSDIQKRKQSEAFEQKLNEVLPRLQKKLEVDTGIKFTKAQITDALKRNPDIKDPVKAVKVEHLDLIHKEQAKKLYKEAPKGHELIESSADKSGKPVVKKGLNSKYGFSDAFQDLGLIK